MVTMTLAKLIRTIVGQSLVLALGGGDDAYLTGIGPGVALPECLRGIISTRFTGKSCCTCDASL